MPIYTRAIERSRAMEAMSNVKAINDAIYMYQADKQKCPDKFKQLVVTVALDPTEGNTLDSDEVYTKFFAFKLGDSTIPSIPGTGCPGVFAQRREGGGYKYIIYNPYTAVVGQAAALACSPESGSASEVSKSEAICKALGIYKAP